MKRADVSVKTYKGYFPLLNILSLNKNHLGIIHCCRTCKLIVSAHHIGFSRREAGHGFATVVEHHETAFQYQQACTVFEVSTAERFSLPKCYLDESSFYHCCMFYSHQSVGYSGLVPPFQLPTDFQ